MDQVTPTAWTLDARRNKVQQCLMPGNMYQIWNKLLLPDLERVGTTRKRSPTHRIRINGPREHGPASRWTKGIPAISGDHGEKGCRRTTTTPPVRLQNRAQGRSHGTLGTNLPTVRGRASNPQRMAKGNGKNRQNQEIHLTSGIPHPVCTQTQWSRAAVVRRLSGIERHHTTQ